MLGLHSSASALHRTSMKENIILVLLGSQEHVHVSTPNAQWVHRTWHLLCVYPAPSGWGAVTSGMLLLIVAQQVERSKGRPPSPAVLPPTLAG